MGDRAISMLRELQRNSGILTVFDRDGIQNVANEIRKNVEEIKAALSERTDQTTFVFVKHSTNLRLKRCILAYLFHRMKQIQELRFVLGSGILSEFKDKMGTEEISFFVKYNKILAEYMDAVGTDITVDDEHPPKELFIEVRGLKDIGDVYTESGGILSVRENVVQYVRRDPEVLSLIRQGILEHLG